MSSPRFIPRLAATMLLVFALAAVGCQAEDPNAVSLLNVSYDPTRELWKDLNAAFTKQQKQQGTSVTIKQSHGGSGSQARSVMDGLQADVVTLALWPDTDALRKKGLLAEKWEERLPDRSLPYYSTIVFVVRKGNPKGVKDWPDLAQAGIGVITPNPRTSGNGKLSFLAAWGSAKKRGLTDEQAEDYVKKLYGNVLVLDAGARGSTVTFAQRNLGDVHLTWENEAHLEVQESNGALEVVYPPLSIKAEPHVAWVDANVDRKKTRAVAESYLRFLYTDEGQDIIAKHHYRPIKAAALERHAQRFPKITLFPLTDFVKDWDEVQRRFFADGTVFDRIYAK